MNRGVRLVVLVLLALGAAATYGAQAWRDAHAMTGDDVAKIPARLERIPLRVGDPALVGTRSQLEPRIAALSGADAYAAIDYRGEGQPAVRLHVGVNVNSEGWLHEPTVCLPAQGWTTTETTLVPIWDGLAGVPSGVRIWRMQLAGTGAGLLVYYWFQFGDSIVTSRFGRAWARFRGLLAGEKDRPVQIVILYTPLDDGLERSAARVESLVRAIWPQLSTILSSGD